MTIKFAKNLIVCVALSTACFATSAQAADGFNKFAAKPAPTASTQQDIRVTSYRVVTTMDTKAFNKTRTVKRVVEPATSNASFFSRPAPTPSQDRFNKMATDNQMVSREMPVVNKRAITIR